MIESEIQHLMDLANGIKKNLTKDVQDIVTKCLHNPVDITSCVTTINVCILTLIFIFKVFDNSVNE